MENLVQKHNGDSDELDNTHYGTSTRYADISQNPTNNSSLELVPLAIQSIHSQIKILQKAQQKLNFSKYFETYWNILNFADFERWYKDHFQKKIRFDGKEIPIRMQSNPVNGFYKTSNLELFITKEFNIIQIKVSSKLREIFTDDKIREMIQQTLDKLETKLKQERNNVSKTKMTLTLSKALQKQQKWLRKKYKR